METSNNLAGEYTELIMFKIKEHIITEPSLQKNHHFNRAYEKIYVILQQFVSEIKGGKKQ